MENRKSFITTIAIVISCMVGAVYADDGVKVTAEVAQDERGIELKMMVSEEQVVVDAAGNKITKLVDTSSVVPGDRLVYTTTVRNRSNALAENVAIVNPIPEHTTYLEGSAQGDGSLVTFSVDGGKRFDLAEKLTVTDENGDSRTAIAKDYTHIRWVLSKLPPKAEGDVIFRAQLD